MLLRWQHRLCSHSPRRLQLRLPAQMRQCVGVREGEEPVVGEKGEQPVVTVVPALLAGGKGLVEALEVAVAIGVEVLRGGPSFYHSWKGLSVTEFLHHVCVLLLASCHCGCGSESLDSARNPNTPFGEGKRGAP